MKKLTKLLKIIGVLAAVLVVFMLFAFVGSIRSSAICDRMAVKIDRSGEAKLLTDSQVRDCLLKCHEYVIGMPLNTIDSRQIESTLMKLPHAENVRVYKTIDKTLMVHITERRPIVRLLDKQGVAAFMDADGYVMPLSQNASMRLPVVTGNFTLGAFKQQSAFHCMDSIADPLLSRIRKYAIAIAKSPFWTAQLQQANVTVSGDFEVFPQVGVHKIIFGDTSEIEEKLERLEIFYKKGLGQEDWNKYSIINLKYKDQIVCTKR